MDARRSRSGHFSEETAGFQLETGSFALVPPSDLRIDLLTLSLARNGVPKFFHYIRRNGADRQEYPL
jgi:hypothetical protein